MKGERFIRVMRFLGGVFGGLAITAISLIFITPFIGIVLLSVGGILFMPHPFWATLLALVFFVSAFSSFIFFMIAGVAEDSYRTSHYLT